MAFQCFNFLSKTGTIDPSLNELVPSSDSDEKSSGAVRPLVSRHRQ